MDMEQVKRRLFGDLGHLSRERQRIRRMIEERVSGDLYFMKKNPLACPAQADGHGVTDEMDLVPACREFDAELGCNHTGTAVGWVAGDPDFHDGFCPRLTEPGEDIMTTVANSYWPFVPPLAASSPSL
jgi:hypothetical protein